MAANYFELKTVGDFLDLFNKYSRLMPVKLEDPNFGGIFSDDAIEINEHEDRVEHRITALLIDFPIVHDVEDDQ